ncbi:MAG: TPM domain-containing protein [Acidobacteriota bacterium]
MMTFLSEADKQRITEAIREAERKTSGELVTVIAHAADAYLYIPMLWASLAALTLPAVIWLLPVNLPFPLLYSFQLATFLGLALLFRWTPLKMRLIPKAVKRRRAGRLAWEQFFAQNLHLTRQRTGVLLFVSVAERYVEILADKGINDKVKQDAWDDIVADFIKRVKAGEITEGFLSAIGACGELLAESFPRPEGDVDELPNRLIEI